MLKNHLINVNSFAKIIKNKYFCTTLKVVRPKMSWANRLLPHPYLHNMIYQMKNNGGLEG